MKKNKIMRYYNSSILFEILSVVLVVAGVLIYWYSWEIWMLGTPMLLIGIVGLVVCNALKVSDSAYEEYFNGKLSDLDSGKREESEPIYTAGGYWFDGNTYAKQDKNGQLRSEIYVRAVIYTDKQSLRIERSVVNAAADTAEKSTHIIPLASLNAAVDTMDYNCKGTFKKIAVMTVSGEGGECRFPVKFNDIETDRMVEELNKLKPKA
ncbi:MAG: hypothetical protein IJ493_03515 [Clostridia bacterium]|nr:hypothetical protein [Clostridia bacterium]